MKTSTTLIFIIFFSLTTFAQYNQICSLLNKSGGFPNLNHKWLFIKNQNNEIIFDSASKDSIRGCRYYNYNDTTALLIIYENVTEQIVMALLKSDLIHEKTIFIYPNYIFSTDYFIVVNQQNKKIYLSNGLVKKCSACFQEESQFICKYYTYGGLVEQDTLSSLQSAIGFVSTYYCFGQIP